MISHSMTVLFLAITISQLSLTQSDISHIGSMKVEGIVHPTTAEIDLKEEIGEALLRSFVFFNDDLLQSKHR